jgi:hypothetical protein
LSQFGVAKCLMAAAAAAAAAVAAVVPLQSGPADGSGSSSENPEMLHSAVLASQHHKQQLWFDISDFVCRQPAAELVACWWLLCLQLAASSAMPCLQHATSCRVYT